MTEPNGTETDEAQEGQPVVNVGYRERDDYVPSPYAQYGTLQTTGVSDDGNNDIREISPVFDKGRVENLQTALKALDPEDRSVSPDIVPIAEGKTTDDVRAALESALAEYQDNPVQVGAAGPAAQRAAEDETGTEEPEGNTEDAGNGAGTDTEGNAETTDGENVAQ